MSRLAFALVWGLVCAAPAWAQTDRPGAASGADRATASAQTGGGASSGASFLPAFDFHLAIDRLSGDDPRFEWTSHWGGEVDVVRVDRLRFVIVGDYEAMLGGELQPFDPNQGNYTLGGFVGAQVGGVEVSAVMHHVSRHLGDRAKTFGIAWNMYGGRLRAERTDGPLWVEGRVDLRGATQRAFVDYRWELDGGVRTRYRLSPVAQLLAAGTIRRLGVDGSRNRGTQTGARLEAGVRFDGRAAALEVFGGMERRIDPWQLEFGTATWAIVGMRIVRR